MRMKKHPMLYSRGTSAAHQCPFENVTMVHAAEPHVHRARASLVRHPPKGEHDIHLAQEDAKASVEYLSSTCPSPAPRARQKRETSLSTDSTESREQNVVQVDPPPDPPSGEYLTNHCKDKVLADSWALAPAKGQTCIAEFSSQASLNHKNPPPQGGEFDAPIRILQIQIGEEHSNPPPPLPPLFLLASPIQRLIPSSAGRWNFGGFLGSLEFTFLASRIARHFNFFISQEDAGGGRGRGQMHGPSVNPQGLEHAVNRPSSPRSAFAALLRPPVPLGPFVDT